MRGNCKVDLEVSNGDVRVQRREGAIIANPMGGLKKGNLQQGLATLDSHLLERPKTSETSVSLGILPFPCRQKLPCSGP